MLTMKPDNEPVFCHSTLVSKHDSKPFEYNDSAFDKAEPKATMKENQNGILCHLDGRNADILKSKMINGDGFWSTPELECSMVVHGFTNINENEAKDSIAPCTIHSDLFEKDTDLYTDKDVMECELPELIVCYKESTYHVVKDICIDDSLPSKDKILIETPDCDGTKQSGDVTNGSVDIELPIPEGLKSLAGKNCDEDTSTECGIKENVDTDLIIPDCLKFSSEDDSDQNAAKKCDPGDSLPTDEATCNATDKLVDVLSREEFIPNSMVSVQEFGTQKSLKSLLESSSNDDNEVEQQSCQIPCAEVIPESPPGVLASEEPNKGGPTNDLLYDSKVESGTITFDFNSSKPAISSSEGSTKNVGEQALELKNKPNHEDGTSDNLSVASQFQRGEGESSFSVAGPVSGLISYSGPMSYSGSVSLRSDSSTTSTRSFAFPVLQSEWNSSPVRMAKADRRHKHRGWRRGLLCFRF